MHEEALTLYAKWANITYVVYVTGGTEPVINGYYGMTVTLVPEAPPAGKQFKEWCVVSGGVTITGNTFSIGTQNVVIQAEWDDVYNVTVNGGTATPSFGIAGATVTLTPAAAPTGQKFKEWTVTIGTGASVSGNTLTIGTSAVTVTAVWETDFVITAGIAAEIRKGLEADHVITVDADHTDFKDVKVNGTTLSADNYTVEAGSTIVTLKADYLKTLAAGVHNVEILFTGGSATTTINILAAPGGTGDDGGFPVLIVAIAVIAIAAVLVAVYVFVIKK
jgi:hypothetical protein